MAQHIVNISYCGLVFNPIQSFVYYLNISRINAFLKIAGLKRSENTWKEIRVVRMRVPQEVIAVL